MAINPLLPGAGAQPPQVITDEERIEIIATFNLQRDRHLAPLPPLQERVVPLSPPPPEDLPNP